MTTTQSMSLRTCEQCAETFACNKWAARKFCDSCQNGQSPRACKQCGTVLSGPRTRQVFCSDTCRWKFGHIKASQKRAESASEKDTDWIPRPGTHTTTDAIQRRKLIRRWADAGYTSRQMSELLGNRDDIIRRIAREMQIPIPADQAINRARRHDGAHILRETAQALDGLAMGVGLVDVETLDLAEAKAWATSMSDSLRTLSRFASKIKEMTRD